MSEPKVLLNQYVYYTPTSNAYKYDEQNSEKEIAEKRRSAAAKKPKLKVSAVLSVAIAAALILGLAGVLVARYERMSSASLKISSLKNQISDIETEIENLNIKLQYAMDINTAQKIAKDDLGMDYPESSQVEKVENWAGDGNEVTASVPAYAAVPASSAPAEGGGD